MGTIASIIILASFVGLFSYRINKLETKYQRLVTDYKELSHHVLITNRDGFRPSSKTEFWKELPIPTAEEAPTDN